MSHEKGSAPAETMYMQFRSFPYQKLTPRSVLSVDSWEITCTLSRYDMSGKEVKMGPVQLPPEVHEAVRILRDKIKTAPVLMFLDFNKPFLLKTDTSKEGLGMVLSKKQDEDPVAFWRHFLTPSEKNYHSSKLKFLALKWSVMEHFKEYLAYASFVVRTDNNLLINILTTPNLDTSGHRWVGMLALFMKEYQEGADNGVADAASPFAITTRQSGPCWRAQSCELLTGERLR